MSNLNKRSFHWYNLIDNEFTFYITGYTGEYCQINIDECQGHYCRNHAVCVDGVNSYTCLCQVGYYLLFFATAIAEGALMFTLVRLYVLRYVPNFSLLQINFMTLIHNAYHKIHRSSLNLGAQKEPQNSSGKTNYPSQ